jgi:hypothetical protein
VWNAYNRKEIILKAGDSTSSWSYNSSDIRSTNADANNKATILCGLAEERVAAEYWQAWGDSGAQAGNLKVGIGWNSVAAISGHSSQFSVSSGASLTIETVSISRYQPPPFIGAADVSMLESAGGANSTSGGGEAGSLMTVSYMG